MHRSFQLKEKKKNLTQFCTSCSNWRWRERSLRSEDWIQICRLAVPDILHNLSFMLPFIFKKKLTRLWYGLGRILWVLGVLLRGLLGINIVMFFNLVFKGLNIIPMSIYFIFSLKLTLKLYLQDFYTPTNSFPHVAPTHKLFPLSN